MPNVEDFISSNIPGSVLKDKQHVTLYYQIIGGKQETSRLTIGYIFNLFELNKVELNLETYLLCQTSLEQVFLFFATKQNRTKYGEEIQQDNEIIDRGLETDANGDIEMMDLMV